MKRALFTLLVIMLPLLASAQAEYPIKDRADLDELRKSLPEVETLMRNGIMQEEVSGLYYFTGYSYRTLYDWDQYFEAIVQIYMGWPSGYIKNGVLLFLQNQKDDGFIARSVPGNEWHDAEHVKPFLSQIALMVAREYGEKDWILDKNMFIRLRKYLDYWLIQMDSDGNGLSEWMSAPHTGMDNQHERAGWWLDRCCEGVDLNCYLVRECQAFASLAEMSGNKKLAAEYRSKASKRAETIREKLYNEADGFYYDRRLHPEGRFSATAPVISPTNNQPWIGDLIPVRSISSFAVLWAQVATKEQAERMVKDYLFNPKEFWTPAPLAVLSRSCPWYTSTSYPTDMGCSWRANTWVPTNYMVYHGLRYYGMKEYASLVAHYTHKLVDEAGDREYYSSETGEGRGLDPFWGWSLLGHFMNFEDSIDEDITVINR